LKKRIKTKQSVVITRNYDGLPFLYYLKRNGVYTLYESHRFSLSKIHPKYWHLSRSKKSEMNFYEKLFLNKLSGILATTPSLKRAYEYVPQRVPIALNRYGCQELPNYENSFSEKALAYAGSIENSRGFAKVLDILLMLPSDYKLHVIGVRNEKEREKIKDSAKAISLPLERITLVPWLSHAELLDYLNKNVSLGLALYRESFFNVVEMSPTKIFDYFSAGIPVVSRRLDSVEDVVIQGKTGETYTRDSLQDIYAAIEKIMASEKKYSAYLDGVKAFRKANPVNRKALDIVQFTKELSESNI
jgi:glycosyltransferase involved in cell wall biosynthesis